jgi:hypothetical protein
MTMETGVIMAMMTAQLLTDALEVRVLLMYAGTADFIIADAMMLRIVMTILQEILILTC